MARLVSNPMRLVPKAFKNYVRFPLKLALLWSILFIGTLAVLEQIFPSSLHSESSYYSYSSNPSSSTTSSAGSISVSSPFSISLGIRDSQVTIQSGAYEGSTIQKVEDNLVLIKSDGATALMLQHSTSDDAEVRQIKDSSGNLLYKIKGDEDGYKIYDASHTIVARVKIKEEKFNIYNTSGARTYYGKEKKGSMLIRNDAGSDITRISATTLPSLTQAAPLCLPLPDEIRAIIYADTLLM